MAVFNIPLVLAYSLETNVLGFPFFYFFIFFIWAASILISYVVIKKYSD